jgi:hypothetical protein
MQDQVPARCPDFVLPSPSHPIKFKVVCLGSTVLISDAVRYEKMNSV